MTEETGRALTRRDFLASGLVSVGALVAGPGLWRRALASVRVTDGPYGPLRPPDANGLRLPDGFTSRVVARSGQRVAGYIWHRFPDGGACFEDGDGWIYVSNSEADDGAGGVSALRFDRDGEVTDAYPIVKGTTRNCSGGATPWETWLTCEEFDRGRVFECDPFGKDEARPLPRLGVFRHEAAAVDPSGRHVYLTEDEPDGRLYRFVPDAYPSLDAGILQVAVVAADGGVQWREVPDASAKNSPTRKQVAGSTRFAGGEGTWFDAGVLYFTTKGDDRVWAYDTRSERLSLLHDPASTQNSPLSGVDNLAGSTFSGDLFVAEDGGDLEVVIITPSDEIAPLLQVTGDAHRGSELAGPALSPDGKRFYISSQRGFDDGITYEITGPFRTTRTERAQTSPSALPLASDDGSSNGAAIAAATAAAAAIGTGMAARRRVRRRSARGASGSDA